MTTESKTPYVLVRIKTPDKRRGLTVRRYTYQGKRFDCDDGWRKVGRRMGEELADLKIPSTDTPIFDVVEMDEAIEIGNREKAEPWAIHQVTPEQAPAVKVKDFPRRQEIQEEIAVREAYGASTGGWDDAFDPNADANTDEDSESDPPDTVGKDEEPKKTPGRKRRSASK